MKKTVSFTDFYDEFQALRPSSFSYDGLHMLFDYLEQYEENTGEEIELDVIGLCCEYNESTYDEVRQAYDLEGQSDKYILDYLNDHTSVIGYNDDMVVYAELLMALKPMLAKNAIIPK